MAKLTRQQVSEKDVFADIKTSADAAEAQIIELSNAMTKQLKLQKEIAQSSTASAKGFKQLATAETKSKQALDAKIIADKKILRLQQQISNITPKQRKELAGLRVETQRLNKVAKEQEIATNKNLSAMERLNAKIRMQVKEYQNLVLTQGRETKASRALRRQILANTAARDKANVAIGRHQAFVGKYQNAIRGVTRTLGRLGLAFGVFTILRSVVSTITDFDSAMTDLGAISNASAEDMEKFKNQALELGSSTQNTAAEIAQLQTELAKLGFEVDDIMASTGPIQKFALAVGADIPDATKLAGATLRAFNLDASEMERVVSVLGVATTKTGLDFNFLNTAMSTIAPVANAFNFSVEDTTALLGQLANSGFDASSAATATRNILLNLADANGKLAQELGRPVQSADDLAAALIELDAKGVDLAETLELTDKRSVAAFNTFLKGSNSLVELRDSITNVSGELDEMSAKKLDSISGATDLLKSAWEGLILRFSEAGGIGELLKDTIKDLAETLGSITDAELKAFGDSMSFLLTVLIEAFKAVGKLIKGLRAFPALFMESASSADTFKNKLIDIVDLYTVSVPFLSEFTDLLRDQKDAFEDLTDEERELITIRGQANAEINKAIMAYGKEIAAIEDLTDAKKEEFLQRQRVLNIQMLQTELARQQRIIEATTNEQRKLQLIEELKFTEQVGMARIEAVEEEARKMLGLQKKIESEGGDPLTGSTGSGGSGGKIDKEKAKLDKLKALQNQHNQELIAFENEMIKAGVDREQIDSALIDKRLELYRKESLFIIELKFETDEELIKSENKRLKLGEEAQMDSIATVKDARLESFADIEGAAAKLTEALGEEEEKRKANALETLGEVFDMYRKEISEAITFVEKFYQRNIELLDEQIEREGMKFDESKKREDELKELAAERGLDASESINAEREAQKRALEETRKLEEKKKQTEALIAALQLLSAQISSGSGNPVANVKANINDLKSFIEGNFADGTEGTIAEALGSTGTKDGHIVAVDDNEHIVSIKDSKTLHAAGFTKTKEIVNAALGYKDLLNISNFGLNPAVMIPTMVESNGNKIMGYKLDQIIDNTNPKNQPTGKSSFDTFAGVLTWKERNNGLYRMKVKRN